MNPFLRNLSTQIFSVSCAIACVSCSESGESTAMKETLLQTEVELLSKRLESLDHEMDLQILQLEKDQRAIVRGSSMNIRDLSEANLTAKIERLLLSPDDFSKLLEDGNVGKLHAGILKLISENKASAKPMLMATLSTAGQPEAPPTFVISDQRDLNIPTQFEPVAGNQTENPDPKLAPKEWMKQDLGTLLNATLLARENDRYLLDLNFTDSVRLKNERYPFPKIFAEKDPGHLEMPVFHEGEIATTIIASNGVPEFIGTTIVPGFDSNEPGRFQAVFITIFNATK